MPSVKLTYFDIAGRLEPTRFCLMVGGVPFEDEILTGESWGKMKPTVAPKQLPLMELDGVQVSQSVAMARWAAKKSSFEGKPLYPECPLAALRVDEMVDMVGEVFGPLIKSFGVPEGAEREAFRAASVAEGGDAFKWLTFIDELIGKNPSGFAVGDHLTLADAAVFAWPNIFRSGQFDGYPTDCLAPFKNITAHTKKIANIPVVKAHYAKKEGVFSVYKA
eukprot:TRINITY_DN1754_c0_g2_i3.p1 TRINITY_DN1754_c0_g2~~TRINITY_DN1754_c0_g2_i3.p1  ORF type:complete len:220 (+),score=85.38 TRINITY_DN1754_c0_g2_i3:74-733(+)